MYRIRIILLVCILAFSSNTFACKCRELTVTEAVNLADGVVVGKILSKQKYVVYESAGQHSFSLDTTAEFQAARGIVSSGFVYDLEVQRVYKGSLQKGAIKIYSGLGQGDCGVLFEVGKKYVVYGANMNLKAEEGYPEGQRLSTNMCSGTKEYTKKENRAIKKAVR